tara:strand:- start:47 stop:1135 length:1089 start_codon:yes stop_codon:yes gene_type:complete
MDTQLQLSENLYPVDEVIGSFVQSILTRKSLHECLYWLWELIMSTPNVADGLTVIYRQFYASSSSNLGRYVSRKVSAYLLSGDIRCLADIVANLRTSKYTGTAYLLARYSEKPTASTIYRRQSWMVGYHPKATQILGALKSRDLENISWHCNIFSNHNGNQITMQVIRQYATNQGIDINDGIDGRYDTQDTLQICAALARIFDHPPWDVRERFVRAPADMVQEMERHFTKNSDKYWKKLTERRLYPTHSIMPPGAYGRDSVDDLRKASQLHWEYYCYDSIEWKTRFEKYEGSKNDIDKSIVFKDDDCLENFYEDDNCMDFDEQPRDVQNMSLHPIQVITDPKQWLEIVRNAELESHMQDMTM